MLRPAFLLRTARAQSTILLHPAMRIPLSRSAIISAQRAVASRSKAKKVVSDSSVTAAKRTTAVRKPRREPVDNAAILDILAAEGVHGYQPPPIRPEFLTAMIARLRSWGVTSDRLPTAIRRWPASNFTSVSAFEEDLDSRLDAVKHVLEWAPGEFTRMLARDARLLWSPLQSVKERYEWYVTLYGSTLVRKVLMRNPPLLTIDLPRERSVYWRKRLNLQTDEEVARVLKHSAIMNCRPEWVEKRISLLMHRMGNDFDAVRSLILSHADLLLLTEANLNPKFDIIEKYLDLPAYQASAAIGKVAMFLTRSMKTTIQPRLSEVQEAGLGFARTDSNFFDLFVKTELYYRRQLNSRIRSPLFFASRALSSALMAEKQLEQLNVHPNLLFPNNQLNPGVFACIRQQLLNQDFAITETGATTTLPDVIGKFMIEKQAYRRVVELRTRQPVLTYIPA